MAIDSNGDSNGDWYVFSEDPTRLSAKWFLDSYVQLTKRWSWRGFHPETIHDTQPNNVDKNNYHLAI
jgi:hypothetical protein